MRQADELLPMGVMRVIGAAKIHVQRTQFVLSIFNTVSIAVTMYYTTPIRRVRVGGVRPFGSLLGWLACIGLVAGAYLLLDRVVVYPAEVSYNSHQASRRERNPGYDVTVDNNERLQRIEDELRGENEKQTEQ